MADPRFLDTYEKVFSNSALVLAGIDELRAISDIVRSAGDTGHAEYKMDVSVVRGLEYYTGPVFEGS